MENYQCSKNWQILGLLIHLIFLTILSQFCRFSYLPFYINEFRCSIFTISILYCSGSRKFDCSTFERSFIFKFEISAIPKFHDRNFNPHPSLIGHFFPEWVATMMNLRGGGQNLEQRSVERPILPNFKFSTIKITKKQILRQFYCQIL